MESPQKPILVTGATGYVASHCIKQLLEQGYRVRGTVRSLANQKKNKFLYELVPQNKDHLELVEADLLKPETWPAAVEGVDYILHVASPFIIDIPKNENILIKPAVEGTLNVLRAALDKGVKKVVVTSSIASVMGGNETKPNLGPEDWSIPEKCGAYMKSKVMAEKAAWKFWEENKGRIEVATVLPSFVVGPLFTYADGASEKIAKEILTGKFPGLPNMYNAMVDVRDVAEIHIKVLFSPQSTGKRYIASSGGMWFKEMAKVLKDEFGKYGYKVTKRGVPNWILKFAGVFSKQVKLTSALLGKQLSFNTELSTKELGIKYHDVVNSVKEMGYSLISLGAVPDLVHKS